MQQQDYQCLLQIHSRWQKEQQLIRKKFQIPYNMTYTSRPCYHKLLTPLSNIQSSSKLTDQHLLIQHKRKKQTNRMDKQCSMKDPRLPPIFCSKCHSNPIECSCEDGIGQWWTRLHQRSSLPFLEKKSPSNSISVQHINFESSLIDLSSIEQSNSHKPHYVLLNWNDRQSLHNFLQTTQLTRNISNLPIEQLRQQISNTPHIHLFDSIIDLLLTMTKNQHRLSLCQIYIDPSYYSTIEGAHPFSYSTCIADNTDLHCTLNSIRKLAILLGLKIDPDANEFSSENLSTKQRKSILNQHSFYLASKMPSNIY